MKQTNWIVITGPPSSGKTTLIQELQNKGFLTSPEVARELIMECLKKQTHEKIETFQRDILAITCRREHFLDVQEMIFFDRGIPDSIAYFKFNQLNVNVAINAGRFRRYKKVFYCMGLPIIKDLPVFALSAHHIAGGERGRAIRAYFKKYCYLIKQYETM